MVQANHTHKVLLFGSGLMTPPLVDYLCSYGDTHITVASNILEDAQKIASRHPKHMTATFVDVFDVSAQSAFKRFYSSLLAGQRSARSRSGQDSGDLVHPTTPAYEDPADLRVGRRQRDHFELHLAPDA